MLQVKFLKHGQMLRYLGSIYILYSLFLLSGEWSVIQVTEVMSVDDSLYLKNIGIQAGFGYAHLGISTLSAWFASKVSHRVQHFSTLMPHSI